MTRSFFPRQFVTSLAILMLVWCQTAAAIQASVNVLAAPVVQATVQEPCHEATASDQDNGTSHGCDTRCLSRDASFSPQTLFVPALDDLPFVVLTVATLPTVAPCSAPKHYIAARAAPPPLLLVYCRLLN